MNDCRDARNSITAALRSARAGWIMSYVFAKMLLLHVAGRGKLQLCSILNQLASRVNRSITHH